MIKLPSGVKIKNLIDDLRIISKEASETLLYYSQIVGDAKNKSNILKNENKDDPVTIADITVNDLIIQKIKEIYQKLRYLCDQGLTVIIFSSDVDEIYGLADRFMVLNRGTVKSIYDQSVQVEQLMAAAGENINTNLN